MMTCAPLASTSEGGARRGVRRCLRAVAASVVFVATAAVGGGRAPAQVGGDPETALGKFLDYPGARTGCVRLDRDGIEGTACVDVHQLPKGTKEADPTKDYFTWQFSGGAAGSGSQRLARVKIRLGSESGEVMQWAPGEDRDVERPVPVDLDLQFADAAVRFDLPAGRLHPATGAHYHHVSWQDTSGKGLACCLRAESGGITQWFVPEGGSMAGDLRIAVSYR